MQSLTQSGNIPARASMLVRLSLIVSSRAISTLTFLLIQVIERRLTNFFLYTGRHLGNLPSKAVVKAIQARYSVCSQGQDLHTNATAGVTQGHSMVEVILVSPPSSDKPARPKRRHGNAQIFDDSEGEDEQESELDKAVAKRLRQVPAAIQEVSKSCHIAILWFASAFSEALSIDDVLCTGRGVATDARA